MAAQVIHEHSIAAADSIDFNAREREVLGALRAINGPATDREVMHRLGKVDPNYVRPSITTTWTGAKP